MGCANTTKVSDPSIQSNDLNAQKKNIENNITSSNINNKDNKAYKPIEQTIQKIIKIQKQDDKNDPMYKLYEKVNAFKKNIELKKGNFNESFGLIQKILKNIANDFANPKFKSIKKDNKKFASLIGRYETGILLMNMIGFRDIGAEIVFSEGLLKSYAQMKIVELNIVYNKIHS